MPDPILSIDESTGQQQNDTTLALPSRLNTDLVALLGSSYSSSLVEKARVADALSFGSSTLDVAFTNGSGGAISGLDSGLLAIDGKKIFLYTYSGDNNLVIAREGTAAGLADPTGAIAFVAYLETNGTGAQGDTDATKANLWVLEFTELQHNLDGASNDDFVTLAGKLNVSVTSPITFDATNAPSGSSLFVAYGDGSPTPAEVGIIVTARGAVNQSNNGVEVAISGGNVVKASQAGSSLGGATFGINSQHFDEAPVGGLGDAAYFTFVKGLATDLTVPNLDQNESDREANIGFSEFFGATKVSFVVCQLQGGASSRSTVQIAAMNAGLNTHGTADPGDDTLPTGVNYIDYQETNSLVDIDKVTIVRGTSTYVFTEGATPSDTNATGSPPANLTVSFSANGGLGAIISGAAEGDQIIYESNSEHNRLLISGAPAGTPASADTAFDIGRLQIETGSRSTNPLGDIRLYDDGPSVTLDLRAGAEVRVDESLGQNGSPETEPAGTLGQITVSGAVLFSESAAFGRDGEAASAPSVYSLKLVGTAPDSGLDDTLSGQNVLLYVDGADIVGKTATGGDPVFRIAIDSSNGAVTLTQYRAMKHDDANDPDEAGTSSLSIASGLVYAVHAIKDADNDPASDDADIGPAMKFEDDGPSVTINLVAGAEVRVDESLGQNGSPETEPAGALGRVTVTAAVLFSETAAFGKDGEAASNPTVYSLKLTGSAPDSGLDDTASGQNVLLYVDGSDIVGKTATGGDVVFRIAINSSDGAVTLTQYRAMMHGDTGDPDEADTALSIASGLVAAVRTITDGDGDTDDDDADIGPAMKFEDDGPAIGPVSDGIVDFMKDASVTKSLLGAIGSDTKTSPYTLTDWTGKDAGDPAIVVNGVTLKAVANAGATSVTYWADTGGDTVFGNTGDTAYYRLDLSQTDNSGAGSYTFTVLLDPPPAFIPFDFTDLPSGQNLLGAIARDKADMMKGGLFVMPTNPQINDGQPGESNDGTMTNSSGTVNTSKGGGPVTIGNANQAFDNPSEGAWFVYVGNPDPGVVGGLGLSPTSADDADTAKFDGTIEVTNASVEIVQASGMGTAKKPGPATHITAWDLNPQTVGHFGDAGVETDSRTFVMDPTATGHQVNIIGVKIYDAAGKLIEFRSNLQDGSLVNIGSLNDTDDVGTDVSLEGGSDDSLVLIEFNRNSTGATSSNADDIYSVTVSNLKANYTIEWVTSAVHDAAKVEWVAGSYDIGGFNLLQSKATLDQVFEFTAQATDGDGDFVSDSWKVGIDGTGVNDDGVVDGVSPATTLLSAAKAIPIVDDGGMALSFDKSSLDFLDIHNREYLVM